MTRTSNTALCVCVLLWMSSLLTSTQAQNSAFISGRVFDPSGATVPGAKLGITNSGTGARAELVTSQDGIYRSPELAPGTYQIEVSASGFRTLVRNGVALHLGDVLGLDLSLEVGEVTDRVVVTAAAPLLKTEEASLGQTVRNEDVEFLPFLSRRPGALLQLTPTVRYVGDDPISFGASRYNAAGTGNVNIVINGAPAGSDRTNVNQQTSNPPVESVQEARVQTNQYSAEYGSDVGPLVLFETKSGGSGYHGSIYEYGRNEVFDTYNAFSRTKAKDRYHVFGGSIGGPIIKNKLFFYTVQEGSKQNNPLSGVLTVPTEAMRRGDFSNLRGANGNLIPIYDPATSRNGGARTAFPGNIIPADRIDSVAKNVAALWPAPVPGAGSVTGANNLPTARSNKIDKWAPVMRFDWLATKDDTVTANVILDRTTYANTSYEAYNENPFASPGQLTAVFRTKSLNFGHTHIFSPNLSHTGRFVYRTQSIFRSPAGVDPDAKFAEMLGIKGRPSVLPDLSFPNFNFAGYTNMGIEGGARIQSKPGEEIDILTTTGLVRRSHYFKWGYHAMRSMHNRYVQLFPNGNFTFDQRATAQPGVAGTGNSIASFLLGETVSASIQGMADPFIWKSWYNAFFVEDAWKVTPRLTLNLGLRWDIDFPLTEAINKGSGFDPVAVNPVSGTPGTITYLGRGGVPDTFYDTDWNRFAPRLGFALRITDTLVARGGYGVFGINPVLGINAGAPMVGMIEVDNSFSTPDNGFNPAFKLDQGFPQFQVGGITTNPGPGFGAVPLGANPVLSPTFVTRDWNFGYFQNFNLSIQKQFSNDVLIEIAGQGALGRKLPISVARNEVPPSLRGLTGRNQDRRPFPQYGNVTDIKAARGTQNYYALTLRGEKRFSGGFSLLGNYSFSKSLGLLGFEDSYNGDLSRGPVLFNQANGASGAPYHAGTVAGVYNLPWGPGRRYLSSGLSSKILGGWTLGGILTLRGGLPFSLSSGIDSLNCACGIGGRLNVIGDLTSIEQSPTRWFNTAAVARPANGQVGNLGPGILTSPSSQVLNIQVTKDTPLTEKFRLRFGAEFFNFTNTPAYGIPGTVFGNPSFGIISGPVLDGPNANDSGVSGARIVQLSLRIDF